MDGKSLPERASLEFLKKLAKERLRELRAANPETKLAAAQLELAREHGFPSWRALKAEIDRRQAPRLEAFFAACQSGALAELKNLVETDPSLVRRRNQSGATGLHLAVAHVGCMRFLLDRDADPNARETDDNALPLHFAAAGKHVDSVRALLDAGSDVQGAGDVHHGDVIGWAIGDGRDYSPEVVSLLIEHGAKHHIFSAIALNDLDLVQSLVEENPEALLRRRSRFEHRQTPLHFALASPDGISPKTPQYEMADLLIELGADLEAEDDKGRTPLAVAMLHGDVEAMRRLKSAGAREPKFKLPENLRERLGALGGSFEKQATPMLCIEDADATVEWYLSIGFTLLERHPPSGAVGWAMMSFGKIRMMLQPLVARPRNQIALWFNTNRIDELYELLKSRQLQAAQASIAGKPDPKSEIVFTEDLYAPFHGGRQFSIRDPNGFELVFQSQ